MRRTMEPDRAGELNMTPMIDVVFQLLIFFMLSMRFQEVEGKLIMTVPRGPGCGPSQLFDEVRIALRDGRVAVENREIGALERADRELYRRAARTARDLGAAVAKPRYVIDAEAETAYAHVLGVVNALKELGIELIEFAADARMYGRLR